MVRAEIQKWFKNNGHFAAGLRLLAMTGEQPHLQIRLQSYMTGSWVPDQAKDQLRAALLTYLQSSVGSHQLAVGSTLIDQTQKPTVHPPSELPTAHCPLPTVEPPTILSLREEARTWHKRHADLKGKLNLMVEDQENYTNEQRAEIVSRIMLQVVPKLDGIYDSIRAWKETGNIPHGPHERDIVQETVQKMNRLQKILPPRISKLKKFLREQKRNGKELTPDEVVAYEKELIEKETEKAKLELELGLHQ